jgi:hypothetical protein
MVMDEGLRLRVVVIVAGLAVAIGDAEVHPA